jgi:hypothetical protein
VFACAQHIIELATSEGAAVKIFPLHNFVALSGSPARQSVARFAPSGNHHSIIIDKIFLIMKIASLFLSLAECYAFSLSLSLGWLLKRTRSLSFITFRSGEKSRVRRRFRTQAPFKC